MLLLFSSVTFDAKLCNKIIRDITVVSGTAKKIKIKGTGLSSDSFSTLYYSLNIEFVCFGPCPNQYSILCWKFPFGCLCFASLLCIFPT